MSKIVASHFWVCEYCDKPLYDKVDMEKHLLDVHNIDVHSSLANAGTVGDNLIVSDLIIPQTILKALEDKDKCPKCKGEGLVYEHYAQEKHEHTGRKLPCYICNGTGKKKLDRPILSKDIVKEIRRITDAPTRADLKPLQRMLQDLSDGLDSPQGKTKSIGQIIGEFAYNKPTYEFTEKEKEQADKVADHIHELYVLSGYGKADSLDRPAREKLLEKIMEEHDLHFTFNQPEYEHFISQILALSPDTILQLKQAVKDARNGKDVDLPEDLYEVFCSIQNQAIEEAPACGFCGDKMSKNPHPNAGKPSDILTVGTQYVCIPCTIKSRHSWAERAMKAEGQVEDIISWLESHRAQTEPPNGIYILPLSEVKQLKSGDIPKPRKGVVFGRPTED